MGLSILHSLQYQFLNITTKLLVRNHCIFLSCIFELYRRIDYIVEGGVVDLLDVRVTVIVDTLTQYTVSNAHFESTKIPATHLLLDFDCIGNRPAENQLERRINQN